MKKQRFIHLIPFSFNPKFQTTTNLDYFQVFDF